MLCVRALVRALNDAKNYAQQGCAMQFSGITLNGLCYPRRMRALIRSTLKLLAQLFQIPSESSGSSFHLFELRSSSESWLNFAFVNVLSE